MKNYPQAYHEYLLFFHADRDYFECHEVLEAYWKTIPLDTPGKIWVGLIQLAVSLYHQRRGNRLGAIKMLESAQAHLIRNDLTQLGIDKAELLERVRTRIVQIKADPNLPFVDMNIPLQDRELEEWCRFACSEKQLGWLACSQLDDLDLIHKHTRRDRSTVVKERQESHERKKLRRGF